MNKKIKMICLVSAILILGCEPYQRITQVCVNYLEPEQYCGTGFFIAPDMLVTADHIIEKAEDNVLTAVGPGINETFSVFDRKVGGVDMAIAYSDHDITDNICPVCTNVEKGAEVEMVGDGMRFKDPKYVDGTVLRIDNTAIEISGTVKHGFSGGPVIDVNQSCVIGSIMGTAEGRTYAANLTTLLKQRGN